MQHDYPEIIIADRDPDFCRAAEDYLDGLPGAVVTRCHFDEAPEADCLVIPGNSFGLTADSCLVAEIFDFLGQDIAQRIQQRILLEHRGEQSVGSCILLETGHPGYRFAAHAPVMRVRMPISYTDNVYRAAWAALLAVHAYNRCADSNPIRQILIPNLGTTVSAVPPAQAARQIVLAYRNFRRPPASLDWHFANNRQQEVRYGGDDGFGFPPEWA